MHCQDRHVIHKVLSHLISFSCICICMYFNTILICMLCYFLFVHVLVFVPIFVVVFVFVPLHLMCLIIGCGPLSWPLFLQQLSQKPADSNLKVHKYCTMRENLAYFGLFNPSCFEIILSQIFPLNSNLKEQNLCTLREILVRKSGIILTYHSFLFWNNPLICNTQQTHD